MKKNIFNSSLNSIIPKNKMTFSKSNIPYSINELANIKENFNFEYLYLILLKDSFSSESNIQNGD